MLAKKAANSTQFLMKYNILSRLATSGLGRSEYTPLNQKPWYLRAPPTFKKTLGVCQERCERACMYHNGDSYAISIPTYYLLTYLLY